MDIETITQNTYDELFIDFHEFLDDKEFDKAKALIPALVECGEKEWVLEQKLHNYQLEAAAWDEDWDLYYQLEKEYEEE